MSSVMSTIEELEEFLIKQLDAAEDPRAWVPGTFYFSPLAWRELIKNIHPIRLDRATWDEAWVATELGSVKIKRNTDLKTGWDYEPAIAEKYVPDRYEGLFG